MKNFTPVISRIAHRIHPKLGKLYDSNSVFWNDGLVGFIIGVPLTWVLYYPLAPQIHFSLVGIDFSYLAQFFFYIICAFISFCFQHILRKRWVFSH